MQLSVVILNYNVRPFLALCLYSVQRALQGIDGEIIVVDNASTDGSVAYNKKHFPAVIWIENEENEGFPKGNNIGVSAAKGEWICILNPDTVVPENIFKDLLVQEQPARSAIGSVRLFDGRGRFLPECKRGVPTPWVALTKMLGFHRFFPHSTFWNAYYAPHIAPESNGKAPILVGALMWMTKEWYQELHGFDEACFMYADDIDLSYRSDQLGSGNYYLGSLQAIHFKGESTIKDHTYRARFEEAMRYFYHKHFKSAGLMSAVITLGSRLFSLFKQQQSANVLTDIAHYILVSDDMDKMQLIESNLKKKCSTIKPESGKIVISQSFSRPHQTALVWDVETLAFSDILTFMYQENLAGWRHYFLLPFDHFLLGSHDSQSRGDYIPLVQKGKNSPDTQ
ncbi:MAG: glycosyl transferase family 2 [Flavobacterium sp. BFFFF2]|nr:MAG: glycosyl transferase family 2 [Flavobacterium sp. BFFFF2]